MNSEINIRQLLYYKSLDQNNIQESQRVRTMQHKLNRFRSTGLSDFRLTTLQTQTPANNFRYGFNVDDHQNKQSQIHFLESYEHPFKHLNSYINESRKNIAQLQEQANKIRLEMSTINSRYENELNKIQDQFRQNVNKKYRLLQEDNVIFMEEQYKLMKEYLKLVKSKIIMEEQQQELLNKIKQLENTLQGVTLELKT